MELSVFGVIWFNFRGDCAISGLRDNVPAAWRRRGFHYRSDGRKTSKFAQTFGRATAPLAPNRPCLLHNLFAKVEKKVRYTVFCIIFFVSLWQLIR